MKNQPKGVPPVTPKSTACEKLPFGVPANLDRDTPSRYTGNYGKKQPVDNSEDAPMMGY